MPPERELSTLLGRGLGRRETDNFIDVVSVEGYDQVLDEAARALVLETPSGAGLRQTAGAQPGWYLSDGNGAWQFVGDATAASVVVAAAAAAAAQSAASEAQSIADSAQSAADTAIEDADTAQDAANSASSAASNAQQDATAALANAATAQAAAELAQQTADTAGVVATAAGGTADAAQTSASAAQLDIDGHQAAADPHTGYVLANGTRAFTGAVVGVPPSTSNQLVTKGYADAADATLAAAASAAQGTADTAVVNAATAQSAANAAQSTASTAVTNAATAQSAAVAAQGTATTAVTNAATAQSTAAAAQSDVDAHEVAADPHTAYVKADGTRAFSAPVSGATPSSGAHFTTKTYVDTAVAALAPNVQVWMPDAPPASPDALNDEFDGATLNAKWSIWDPGSIATVALNTSRRVLSIQAAGNATTRVAGVYQSLGGATEYAAYAQLSLSGPIERGGIGIMLGAPDLVSAPATANAYFVLFLRQGTTADIAMAKSEATDYLTFATTSQVEGPISGGYVRARVTGTTVYADFSNDGIGWAQVGVSAVMSFTPAYIGTFVYTFENVTTFKAFTKFFRFFSGAGTSAFDATYIGRQVSLRAL